MDISKNSNNENLKLNKIKTAVSPTETNDEEDFKIIKQIGNYQLLKFLGRGTFGVVYMGKNTESGDIVAIKRYFMNLHPNLCQMEISILSYLKEDNVLKIIDGFIDNDEIYLVTPYQKHSKFSEFYQTIKLTDLKKYMHSLLSSLENIHRNEIVHRDIKPDNFLYDLETNKYLLIDFGLSESNLDEVLITGKRNPINTNEDDDLKIILDIQKNMGIKHRIGTRGFLAPEVIFNARTQSKSVDIWSAGVLFLAFLSKRFPVFNLNKFCKIQDESLRDIEPLIIVFGRERIIEIAQKHQNLLCIPEFMSKLALVGDLAGMIERDDIDEDGVDLLRKLLELDCDLRITAEEAKNHKFFKDIN